MNAGVIKSNLEELLTARGKSLYWLAKETKLNYGTLWKLRKSTTDSIEFRVLEKVCLALQCGVEELLQIVPDKKGKKGD